MPSDRDVRAFDERSAGYETGVRGELHHRIADRTLDLALTLTREPAKVLDVGCGTGYLLRQLALRCPSAAELAGVDPASGMVEVARSKVRGDTRFAFSAGRAEHLPYGDAHFDLLMSTTSFDHWEDQGAGLAECARVLAPGGRLVLTDLFSRLFAPTLVVGRRTRARTPHRATALLEAAGLRSVGWHRLRGVTFLAGAILRTATALR